MNKSSEKNPTALIHLYNIFFQKNLLTEPITSNTFMMRLTGNSCSSKSGLMGTYFLLDVFMKFRT